MSFFTLTTVNQTDSAERRAEPTNTALPTPQWGESQISRRLKKERILSLAGGRTRSIGRYPERERTFSQKHSVKEQIKQ